MNNRTDAALFLSSLFSMAFARHATDIHIQPEAAGFFVRLRVHGVLTRIQTLSSEQARRVLARIKVLACLDSVAHMVAQDGVLRMVHGDRACDVRVSFFPCLYGEKVVLRLLMPSQEMGGIEALSFSAEVRARLALMARLESGFILVTGPTGSGKTTTLHALIRSMDCVRRSVVTLEDPIEYRLPGVMQTEIAARGALSWSHAVRSVLRQDPDVVLVGELRDRETVEGALELALTGHLVLSSLHTAIAAAAPLRLAEMGVDRALIAQTLTGVVAQRLVPLICQRCTATRALHEGELAWARARGIALTVTTYGRGCAACQGTGVSGQRLLAELWECDRVLRARLVSGDFEVSAVHEYARSQGMVSLLDQAIMLCQRGEISFGELFSFAVDAVPVGK